jgi:type I restriction enzyme S subunit
MISFAETKQKWQTKKLGDVSEAITRGISPKYIELGGVCVLNQRCIRDHLIDYSFARIHDVSTKQVNHEKFIQVGDILVNSTGTGTLGRIAQVKEFFKATVDSHVTIIRPKKNLFFDPFFGYALMYLEETIQNCGTGACGQIELPRVVLQNELTVSFPTSLTEQRRIVSILDEAFSEIDEAKVITEKNLENARQLFESYLEKIFTNHRSDWRKNNLKSLTTKIGSGATPLGGEKAYKSSGISLIRSLNVYDYEFRLKNLAFIDDEQAGKLDNVIVMEDDVLLNITGASVARCFLVPFNILPARVNQHVSIIRCSKDQILPEFLHYLLISKPYKDLLLNTGEKGGATRQALTKNQIENFVIKYPILDEQIDIIGKLDKLLKESTKLKILYNQKLTHLEELKKSILKQAFEGKL